MMSDLTAADGHQLECWIEPALATRKGGVVILQEIFGVTDQLKGVAQAYATQGYEVAFPALFDRHEKGAVIPFDQGPYDAGHAFANDARPSYVAAAADKAHQRTQSFPARVLA